jgi:signal transduction histidine kinase/streptogramin lyase
MVCIAATLWCASALALDPSLRLTQYRQQVWTPEDGLPQSSVRAITQTADGYLWIGTEQGLVRFDGARFVPFELRAADGILDGYVNTLYTDADTVLVGTDIGIYRLTDGGFVEILTDSGGSVGSVWSILRDRSARLWICADTGLWQERDGRAVVNEAAVRAGIGKSRSIAESPGGKLCLASDRKAFCLEDNDFHELPSGAFAGSQPNPIAFDSFEAMWAGTPGSGILQYENGRWRTVATEGGSKFIVALLVDSHDSVWIGSPTAGLGRISRRGFETLPGPLGQTSCDVMTIYEDRTGNLWFGTNFDGLVCLSRSLFTPFSVSEGLRESSVNTVLEDHDKSLWIGTAGGGLHRLAGDQLQHYGVADGLPADNNILSLAVDRQGRLWVGAPPGGILRQEGDHFVQVPGSGRVVLAIHEDLEGRIWAGRLGGVIRLEDGVFQSVESLQGFNAVAIDSRPNGEVWFASAQGGVKVWRDGKVTHLGGEQGFPDRLTVTVHAEADGAMWVGSHLGGLTWLGDDALFTFTTEHGLCDNSVFTILEGPAGRLWMSSNMGIFAVDKEALEAVARGQAERVDCRLFGEADGMRSAECNGGQSPSAWRDHAGRLWFATVDGVARVDPRDAIDRAPPSAIIEQVSSSGEAIDLPLPGADLVLPPGNRGELAIRYTAISLTDASQLQFRYRLQGPDHAWVEAGERRVAYYTNLPPRRHRFQVQTRIAGSSWGEPGATLSLRVEPRFHETWWFLGLVVIALVSLALAAHRGRVATLRRRQRRLQKLVAERTQELEEVNATLEQRIEEGVAALRESDRMAAYGHLVAGVAHEVRHPIFALRAAAHLLSQKLADSDETRDELDILGRETERMSRLVDDLLELGRPRELELQPWLPQELIDEALASLAHHPETNLRFVRAVDKALPPVMADRPAMVQVLVNLLHNACLHAVGATQVIVGAALNTAGDRVCLTVADDGHGISLTDRAKIFEPFFSGTGGTGLGLAIASQLVREHGGRLTVDSEPGQGAVFTMTLVPAENAKIR